MMKTSLSQSSEFLGLNDDEIKRIASVIERDFQLRQKEYKRIEELKKLIQQEHERREYLPNSKQFNNERCIRCLKPFTILFNPKELCPECDSNVCHNCATFNKQTKTWSCNTCLKLKELESLTADWFYLETRKKHKRCGSAKVVRELYKREKQLNETDEDPGYETLRKSFSTDSRDSIMSYIVHDKNLQNELNEYLKRMNFLLDNLQSDLSNQSTRRENLKHHQQQITSEINRARTALSGPLRRSNKKLHVSYEIDLQNLLIHKTEEILQMNLQEFQKDLIESNFDQKLAQIIFDKYVKKDVPEVRTKLERQPPVREMKSRNDNFRTMDLSRTPTVDEEDTEKEEEEEVRSQNKTSTTGSIDNNNRRFIETDLETIQKSTKRVVDWKTNCTLIESKIVPSDDDDQEKYSTWL